MSSNVQFLIDNWVLVAAAVVSGTLLLRQSLAGGTGQGISPDEAVRLMNREKAAVIDVCEPDEFAAGHVIGSRSIPLATLGSAQNLPSNKEQPLIVVCASGMRATRAAAQLRKQGYAQAQPLRGGMKAWREAGLPVETGSKGKA